MSMDYLLEKFQQLPKIQCSEFQKCVWNIQHLTNSPNFEIFHLECFDTIMKR